MRQIIFSHGGKLGDVICALTFIKEFGEAVHADKVELHLQTDIPLNSIYDPDINVLMSEEGANCIAPLLRLQPYLSGGVSISPELPANAFDLHKRLLLPLNFFAGNIIEWCYPLCAGILPRAFHKPVLTVPTSDERARNKIIIFRSPRYQNPFINYSFLSSYVNDILFLGLPEEHRCFKTAFFDCQYLPTADYLECAQLMAAARCVIGNQTGLFAIAEQMKVPRILESCQYRLQAGKVMQGCPTVIPTGGVCASIVCQKQFEMVIDCFLGNHTANTNNQKSA